MVIGYENKELVRLEEQISRIAEGLQMDLTPAFEVFKDSTEVPFKSAETMLNLAKSMCLAVHKEVREMSSKEDYSLEMHEIEARIRTLSGATTAFLKVWEEGNRSLRDLRTILKSTEKRHNEALGHLVGILAGVRDIGEDVLEK